MNTTIEWPTGPNFHHVGVTVPDMQQAINFLTDLFECELLFQTNGGAPLDEFHAKRLNTRPGGQITGLAMLKSGGGLIELFTYEDSNRQDVSLKGADVGSHHIAFYVPDIEDTKNRIIAAGGRPCGDVATAQHPAFQGLKWMYFLSPWGQHMEVVQVASGCDPQFAETAAG